MVFNNCELIMRDPKNELPGYEDNCVDLVMTAPPGSTMTDGFNVKEATAYHWDTFEDYINI